MDKKIYQIVIGFLIFNIMCMPTYAQDSQSHFLNRGKAVAKIVDAFKLQETKKNFLSGCMANVEECFFVFSAKSDFDHLEYEPLRLYPDVSPAHQYYDAINTATVLEIVEGFMNEKDSPFRPQRKMTRIQALKIILGAKGALNWKERSEVVAEAGGESVLSNEKTVFKDVSGIHDHMWWYMRYVNFALDKGIILSEDYFRPDEFITEKEFDAMLQRAIQ